MTGEILFSGRFPTAAAAGLPVTARTGKKMAGAGPESGCADNEPDDRLSGLLAVMQDVLRSCGSELEECTAAVMTSVVPKAAARIKKALEEKAGIPVMQVDYRTDTGMSFHVDRPETVGNDLIVGTAAASELYGAPAIVIDMGTATTFAVVDEDLTYQGHVILPGARISLDALTGRTAQLPEIELQMPPSVLGKNTADAMESGILYGNAAMIDGMLDRLQEELDETQSSGFRVVATGGLSGKVVPLCRHEILLDKDLLLKGLYCIYKRNCRKLAG